jgi:hypothetical protein
LLILVNTLQINCLQKIWYMVFTMALYNFVHHVLYFKTKLYKTRIFALTSTSQEKYSSFNKSVASVPNDDWLKFCSSHAKCYVETENDNG